MGDRKEQGPDDDLDKVREINVTAAGLRSNRLYVPLSFFPMDVIGGGRKEDAAEKLMTITFGDGSSVQTDIDGEKRTLRCRGAVSEFIIKTGLKEGDRVLITRLSRYHYQFTKAS